MSPNWVINERVCQWYPSTHQLEVHSDSSLIVFPGHCWITVSLGSDVVHALGLTVSLWDLCILNVALGLKEEIRQYNSWQLGRPLWIHLASQVFLVHPALEKESIFSKNTRLSPVTVILCEISTLQCLMSHCDNWAPPGMKHNGLYATSNFHLVWVIYH